MMETRLTFPELGLIAGTRAMLGGGIALLLADRLNNDQRKMAGWILLMVGAVTTVPLGIMAYSKRQEIREKNLCC